MSKFEAVIGLEIHAELKTNSKMFCSCANSTTQINTNENANKRESKPTEQNLNVCPVCLGMPGMLPVLNRQAIEWTILTGLALNCKIGHPFPRQSATSQRESALMTKWDRKNYFYPDLPKGYQISQYDLPIAHDGSLKLKTENEKLKTIGITRIHLEEDTGTSKHPEGRVDIDYSLMDYNRAGVPLMELVTDAITLPIEEAGKIAKKFCQKYQLILRYLGVADADMEKGQMRCEANISVKPVGQKEFGTKVEVKNLNSFKAVEKAIEYEIEHQINEIKDGKKIIQETRGWDDAKGRTYIMRVKETSADYRYFPEPDLPPVKIVTSNKVTSNKEINIEKIKEQLPELPDEKIKKYINLAIPEQYANIIVSDIRVAESFDKTCKISPSKMYPLIADWYVNIIKNSPISEKLLVELLNEVKNGKINRGMAKDILPDVIKGKSPLEIIKEKGLAQISDGSALEKIVKQILSENSEIVRKIKSGKCQAIGFLVGQVMSRSKGQANPQSVHRILKEKLDEM